MDDLVEVDVELGVGCWCVSVSVRVWVCCVLHDGSREVWTAMGLGETARGIIEEECVCEFARYGKDRRSHVVHVVAHIVLGESLGRAEEVRGSAGVCCRAFCERPTTHLVAVGLYPVVVFSALAVGHGTQYPWVAANQPTGEARDPHAAGDTSRGFRCRQIFTKLVVVGFVIS